MRRDVYDTPIFLQGSDRCLNLRAGRMAELFREIDSEKMHTEIIRDFPINEQTFYKYLRHRKEIEAQIPAELLGSASEIKQARLSA